jgi:RHS repeat-associated protein
LTDILDENHYYAYGLELPGSFINVAGTNYNYKFNGIERVESFNMDFAYYRSLDPILGRWYQVDPGAEMYANISTYCGMNNNPTNEVDPLGDSPVHIGAAIVGAGINIYNNWSSIVKNPWSAIGYAGTGALAGVVSVSGGVAAAAKITAIGNLATDAISGNAPDIKSVNDAFNYGVKTVGNALDVAGAGKIANAGIKGLQKLGLDLIPEAANIVAEAAT